MSQQGPILVVSTAERRPSFAAALDEAKLFPVVEADWADAARAVGQLRPGASLSPTAGIDEPCSARWPRQIARSSPICR